MACRRHGHGPEITTVRGSPEHLHDRPDACKKTNHALHLLLTLPPDYYTRHHPAKTKAKAIKQLQTLGYSVTLEPHTEAA